MEITVSLAGPVVVFVVVLAFHFILEYSRRTTLW